ncbi:MAG: hypothetical protein IT371_13480 [Deltaproteobacteria bacterium]|nr:hypothetical protein [Deltaproteobacteria bacterium]
MSFFERLAGRPRRLGFHVSERMTGTHRTLRELEPLEPVSPSLGRPIRVGSELPFSFEVRWGHPDLVHYLNPLKGDFTKALLEGTVTAGGLCTAAPLRGTLDFRYVSEALIRYAFEFEAHGRRFRYVGEKRDLRPWNLHRTHTTCHGTIADVATGQVISDSVVYFDLKELPSLVGSFRLE